ncbi:MAG: hypothetical protein U0271_43690 [Polyangiaceae bacterium]
MTKKQAVHASDPLQQALEDELRSFTSGEPATPPRSSLPFAAAVSEALSVAAFVDANWVTTSERGAARPGLDQAGPMIRREIADELRALVALAQATQAARERHGAGPVDPVSAPVRARVLLRHLDDALELALDEQGRGKLLALRRAQPASRSAAAIAQRLASYVEFASRFDDALAQVAAFDKSVLTEGKALAQALRRRRQTTASVRTERQRLVQRRNRLLALIQRRVRLVRAAARLVLSGDPARLRLVTSAFERERRQSSRRGRKNGAALGSG